MVLFFPNLVIISGPTDFNLETVAANDNGVWLKRVMFEKHKGKEKSPKFFYVKCCQQNTFMIDMNYQLWGFGESLYGQLGEKVETVKNPINLSLVTKIKFDQISGGTDFLIAHSLSKHLYIWGNLPGLNYPSLMKTDQVTFTLDKERKQLQIKGLDITRFFNQQVLETGSNFTSIHSTKRNSKVAVQYYVDIQALATYNNSLYILTKDCVLHSFGVQINVQQKFCGISCGPNHALAWDEIGNVWSWGFYQDGKLGYMRFEEAEQKEPKLIADFKAKAIQCVCGANYSIALDVKGNVHTWGKGPFKLDLSRATMPTIIMKKKSPFIKIAAGSEHFGAINSSGQLYVWGNNRKGSIFNFPEELFQPTHLPIEQKIVDFDMQLFTTVLIVQNDAKQHLPLLNFEHFKTEQYKVISEDTNLIQSYLNKKTALEFEKKKIEAASPMLALNEIEPDLKVKRIKSFRASQSSTFVSSGSLNSRIQSQIRFPILFDSVQFQLMKLEQESQLYVPIAQSKTVRTTRLPSQENIELESVIISDNDQLKYEYIQLAREKDEEGLLLSILNDVEQKQEKPQQKMLYKSQINQFKHKFKISKPIYHDKYDQFDKSIIQTARNQILELHSMRAKKVIEQKKQRELEYERITHQSIQSIQPLQSKEQLMLQIRLKAEEHTERVRIVNQKKQEISIKRTNYFSEQLYEKSMEYKNKQRQLHHLSLVKQQVFNEFLTYFNQQHIFQLLNEIPSRIKEKNNNYLQHTNSAIIIQRYFRKKYLILKQSCKEQKQIQGQQ